MSVITVENLTYAYSKGMPDETVAVNDISASIEAGEFIGIIGHTGSGKSTFIQHLNGLLKPTSGRVLIDGTDIWQSKDDLRDCRFKVGLVFQYPEYQLFEETVYRDVAFGPKNMGLSAEEVDARVRSAVRSVGLGDDCLDRSPFELSGGEKRRAAIAGVLAMEPKVLILDEPTAGLDPAGRAEIIGDVKRYHDRTKNTVLLVSHSMEDIAKNADRVMVIDNAKLWAFDKTDEVFARAGELEKMGLEVPPATAIMLRFRRAGLNVPLNVYTAEDAARALLSLRKGGDRA